MQQPKKLNRLLGVAALAMLFGATSAVSYAQSGAASSGSSSSMSEQQNRSTQMDSSGQSGSGGAMSSGSGSSAGSTDSSSGAAGVAGTSSTAGKALSKSDQDMMRDMAQANLAEIEAGRVAQSQASSDQVKSYAQKMIDDHTQAQKDLEQLAQSKGFTLPTQPDNKHMAEVKKLSTLQGDKFDKQYMQQGGLRDHRETHRLLQRVEQRASDPQLKSLAAKTLPIVDQHLTMAQDVRSGKSSSSGSSSTSPSSGGASSSSATPSSGASDSSGTSSTGSGTGAGSYSK